MAQIVVQDMRKKMLGKRKGVRRQQERHVRLC